MANEEVMRSLEELEQEREGLHKRANSLLEEIVRHPDYARRQREILQRRLRTDFPPDVLDLLLFKYKLEDVILEERIDENNRGKPARLWCFDATFQVRDPFSCQVDLGNSDEDDDFTRVDFYPRPLTLWDVAMHENENDPGKALAAFCFACCEYDGDFGTVPNEVFPTPKKDKTEIC